MKLRFYVKFQNIPPELYTTMTFEEFWHILKERMLEYSLRLEWIISD